MSSLFPRKVKQTRDLSSETPVPRSAGYTLKLITTEINWPYNPILGSAISTMHYYTIPASDLVFAPSLESFRLLSIADIYHELAHFCCARDSNAMNLSGAISRPLSNISAQAMQQSWPRLTVESFIRAMQRWLADWKIEFACDLIATFWLGPAYAWTNVRLCFTRSDVFTGIDTHPADHARQVAIEKMLGKMGLTKEQAEVHSAWKDMLNVSNQTKPQTYDVEYPVPVIDALVATVHAYCSAKNLNAYDPAKRTVGAVINQAWENFLNDPANYATWESQALSDLDKLALRETR